MTCRIGAAITYYESDMGAISASEEFYAKTMLRYAENRLIKLKFWNVPLAHL
jgi:hypothetical protein